MQTIVDVTAAIISHDGSLLIARRDPGDRLAGLWEFPGGKIEAGETPQECLKRELWEELKMKVSIGPFLGDNTHHYDHISIRLMVFRAFVDDHSFDPDTHSHCRWVTPDRLCDYAFTLADMPFVLRLADGEIPLD